MKVLLVNGSPRKEGCTYTALCEVAKSLNEEGIETEIFWVGNKPLSGCIACYSCFKTGKCALDDCVNEFNEKAREADGFIFGSPVHYAAAGGTLTAFMDRVFYSSRGLYRLKPAAAIVSARRAGTTAALDQLNKYFTISGMPVASSSYWNIIHGGKPGEAEQDAEGIRTMRNLAKNMVFLMNAISREKKIAGLPESEKKAFTNFIR